MPEARMERGDQYSHLGKGERKAAILCKIVNNPIDVEQLIDFVKDPAAGAVATFLGITRDNTDGRRVIRLEYEAYRGMAEGEMIKIARELQRRWDVKKVAIVHRLGEVEISEASVGIAVSSAHRREAFAACHYAIDRLKETVPIWKKEYYAGGEMWIGTAGRCQGKDAETR